MVFLLNLSYMNRGGEPLVIKTGRHAIISTIKQVNWLLDDSPAPSIFMTHEINLLNVGGSIFLFCAK